MGGRHIAALALALVFVATPTSALAAALSETQIQSILSLLSAFGADAGVVTNVSAALRGQATVPTVGTTPGASGVSVCVDARALSAGLHEGSTGDAVTKLQRLLASDRSVYPEGLVTGYFGALTTAALRRCNIPAVPVSPTITRAPSPTCSWHLQNSSPDPGEDFTISWTSTNADTVTDGEGNAYKPNDQVVLHATTPGTFQYPFTFRGTGGSVVCTVPVTVAGTPPPVTVAKPTVSGSVTTASISSQSRTLQGTATNTSEVRIYISENGGTFTNGTATVIGGEWAYTSVLPFSRGSTYVVYVYSYPGALLIASKEFVAL